MFTFQCSLYDFINIQTRPFCCNNSQAPAHLEFNVNTKTVILVDVKSAGYGVRTDSKFELQLNEPFWGKKSSNQEKVFTEVDICQWMLRICANSDYSQ